ncbi:DinB family protein [Algoriphagus litoralis]|uniref:DinB family protein n=1 Tax=Algoriphagus litoralis TaxID=2202829 RepID=UPI000DBABE8E|nr:DinB family protein [Algoriphagus litoralis]
MNQSIKAALWCQFGASIDMLENAIRMCPEEFWNSDLSFSGNAYHTLFFLDYYLTLEPVGFGARSPFTHSEFEDEPPSVPFLKIEILNYLEFNRNKCRHLIMGLTAELSESRWINESKTMDYSIFEILLYNMRHVQHHAAQLNMMLRNHLNDAPNWVYRAQENTKL